LQTLNKLSVDIFHLSRYDLVGILNCNSFKRATPTEWYVLLLEEKSLKTTVNIKKENIISTGRVIDIDTLVNKDFYNIIKNRIFVKPIGIHVLTTYLEIQDIQNKTNNLSLNTVEF
jgi:phosphoribosyl-dephospho-CoA transferase